MHYYLLITVLIEVLQGVHLSLNGFLLPLLMGFSHLSAIMRVNGIRRSIAKTIVTISILIANEVCYAFDMYYHISITKKN